MSNPIKSGQKDHIGQEIKEHAGIHVLLTESQFIHPMGPICPIYMQRKLRDLKCLPL